MDQKKLWQTKWSDKTSQSSPNNFANRAYKLIKPKHKTLLDLGCGNGRDSLYFARKGLRVTAADWSQSGLNQLRKLMEEKKVANLEVVHSEHITWHILFSFDSLHSLRITHIADFCPFCYNLLMNIQTIKTKTTPILENEGVIKAAVFGSHATGEATQNSDVDLLVELEKDKSLLDLVGLKLELEDCLQRKVDLVTYDAIHPPLKDIILKEQHIIYEKRS